MQAVKDLIFRMGDDQLIIGHRHSEWTGLGPIMEEDIALSSMAQDKIGHALANYSILEKHFQEQKPDTLAFNRNEKDFRCAHLVELPNGEYDFSLMRQFLFDHAEWIRYDLLSNSSFEPLKNLSKKIKGELKYHLLHADTWVVQLGNGTEESHARMQTALNEVFPFALGLFEEGVNENELIDQNIFVGEKKLQSLWEESISEILVKAHLRLPDTKTIALEKSFGGRKGYHTEHLQPLLTEMVEVFSTDLNASW